MARTPETQRLVAAAYQLGDEYYRRLTRSAWSSQNGHDGLAEISQQYLSALETLAAHLKTIDHPSDHDAFLIESTDQYIELVHSNIKRLSSTKKDVKPDRRLWPI